MSPDVMARVEGAAELAAWYGGFPGFHDAYVVDFQLRGDGSGHMRLQSWRMTDKLDEQGYFVVEKQFQASLFFDGVTHAELRDFQPGQAILYSLELSSQEDEIEIVLQSSYGFDGTLRVKTLRIAFQPETEA